MRVLGFLALFAAAASPALGQSVSHTVPGAVRPGETVELTLHGAKLNDPLQVWASFPAKIELLPADPKQKEPKTRQCKVTVDASVPAGLGGLVIGTPAGTSGVVFLPVDDLPSVADNGKNFSPESAQAVTLPVAVDGAGNGPQFDHYAFSVKAGQRVAVEVMAARVGSAFDPVVRLFDAEGQLLELVDDDPSLGADCRLGHTFEKDGQYVLQLHDNQYRSGGRYRLRIGDFPLASAPYPLGGRSGSTSRFQFAGPQVEGAQPVFLRLPDRELDGQVEIAARFPDGKSSSMLTLATSQLPESLEIEPNNESKTATPVTLPCAVNGLLQETKDRDCYTFAATKGQSFQFRSRSRSLGSPSVLYLRIYDAAGKQLAQTSVDNSHEFTLSYTFPADGMYCLMVEDLLRRGGAEHAYRVEIEPNSGFSLAVKNDKNVKLNYVTAVNNGALATTLQIARRGYDGPITLSLDHPDSGFRLFNPNVPAKAKEHRLIVGVPQDAKPGDLHVVRILGRAEVDGQPQAAVAQTQTIVRAQRPQLPRIPGWVDGLLTVATGNQAEPFFATSGGETIAFPSDQGKAETTLKLERKHKDFKAGIVVMLQGLPDGFSYAVKADKDNYQLTIQGPKGAPAGEHSFQVVAYGDLNGNGQLQIRESKLQVQAAAQEKPAG